MKYTANYNLYKPDYDDTIDVDFLNKNMDILDNQLNGLDYVENVNTSDNTLTFIKRNGDTIDVPIHEYYPVEVIDKREATNVFQTTRNANNSVNLNGDYYKIVKYSDGTMTLDICVAFMYDDMTDYSKLITFPVPFLNDKLFIVYGSLDVAHDERIAQYVTDTVTNTNMRVYNYYNSKDRLMVHITGQWK